jgi:lipid II:glycine glycyltransferase (peptidoglycan interpeptide bridge formation enzyme)
LADLYHKKIHKPLPPYSLFEHLTDLPFTRYFFVLNPQGEVIGGQLILMLGQHVGYAWYCCGLDREQHDLYPSIMANYAAIRYAADHGFDRYDMMGAGSPKEDYGVRDFKAQFGGTLVEHGRFLHINNQIIYYLGKHVLKILNVIKK